MSRKYKFIDVFGLYFVSYATVGWVDIFIRNEYKEIVLKSLQHCIEHKELDVYAWCIMTSHVHLIIGSRGKKMEEIIRDHKRHTSEMIHKAIASNQSESRREWMMNLFVAAGKANGNNRGFQLWQQNNQPIMLDSASMLYGRLAYLHENPVVAGFVSKPEDWNWSSAVDYYTGQKGMLKDLKIIEPDSGVR